MQSICRPSSPLPPRPEPIVVWRRRQHIRRLFMNHQEIRSESRKKRDEGGTPGVYRNVFVGELQCNFGPVNDHQPPRACFCDPFSTTATTTIAPRINSGSGSKRSSAAAVMSPDRTAKRRQMVAWRLSSQEFPKKANPRRRRFRGRAGQLVVVVVVASAQSLAPAIVRRRRNGDDGYERTPR